MGVTTVKDIDTAEWERVSADPDLREDLGYELSDLKVIRAQGGTGDVLFLPWEETMIEEEAFIVAEPDAVVELLDVR